MEHFIGSVDTDGNAGEVIDLYQGWHAIIHSNHGKLVNGKFLEHIEVWNDKARYGVFKLNEDGSYHDKPGNPPDPPTKVRKSIKKKTGWDWDALRRKFNESKKDTKISPLAIHANYEDLTTVISDTGEHIPINMRSEGSGDLGVMVMPVLPGSIISPSFTFSWGMPSYIPVFPY